MAGYINIPVFYTGGNTTNSGLVNEGGAILHPTIVGYVNTPLGINVDDNYGYFEPGILDSQSICYSTPMYPLSEEVLNCSASGCLRNIGFNYYSYAPEATPTYFLYQIYSKDPYVYAATSDGLEVYRLSDNEIECTKSVGDLPVNTIHGIGDTLYLGTTNGLYTTPLINICAYTTTLVDYDLNSEYINYIHGINNKLFISTDSSIEYIDNTSNPKIHSKTFISSAGKCFLTEQAGYYISTISGSYILNRIDNCLCDWVTPSHTYDTTGSGVFREGLQLNDLYVTEGTAAAGGNTIFCTTSSGVYVIDEDNLNYAIYYTR